MKKKTFGRLFVAIIILLTGNIVTLTAAEIEEIIITAERKVASVQDTPIAVSAYGQEQMDILQIENTIDLINVVPNLFGGNNTGLGTANMYYLRGQGNDESISTFDPPVGTYIDEVYVTRQNANNFALFDVERIEVLRGPQGTLYGRNTTGGAISLVMRKPSEENGGFIEAGVGTFGRTTLRGSVDMPMSETVFTKFSAYSVQDDGYLKNTALNKTYNAMDNTGFRAAARVLISDTTTWDVALDVTDTSYANVRGAKVGDDRVSTASATINQAFVGGSGLKSNGYGNDVEATNFVSNLSIDMGTGTTSFIVGKRDMEQKFLLNFPNGLSDDFFAIDNDGNHEMTSVELKWSGDLENGSMTFGIYYMDEENVTDFADYLDFGGIGLGVPGQAIVNLADRVLSNDTKSASIYAQADLNVGSGILTLGGRYTDDEKTIAYSGGITTQALVDAGVPIKLSTSKFTPRIAYKVDINENAMAYVSATKGFKSGGWNSRATTGPAAASFDPEQLWSYELGLRGDYMNNRLRTNITVFHSDLEDLQTTAATPDGQFLTTNAGGLRNTGVEAEITYLPNDNLQMFFAMGFQDAKYVDLPPGCATPNTSIAAFDLNCIAADPKRTPDHTYTIGINGDYEVGDGLTFSPYASARIIGENVTATRQQGLNESGETTVNAGFALSNGGPWTLRIECNNCSDNTYTTSFLFVPYFNPPRTYTASLKWVF